MIRRRLQPTSATSATIYSLSRPGKEIKHTVNIDMVSGKVSCTCEAFLFTKRNDQATVFTPELFCKHITREAELILRKAAK